MKTLVSILGSTATGKTSFALKLATQALELENSSGRKIFTGVDLISADSRQIYKGLEILSGADVPDGFTRSDNSSHFENKGPGHSEVREGAPGYKTINLHGVSILDLTDEWSVAHFKNFAVEIIINSFANKRLPIIVGGTNLYINHLFNRDNDLYIKPIEEVRSKASEMSVEELQSWLRSVNSEKLSKMNNSDINNPRRLIRAIEISLGQPEVEKVMNLPEGIKNLKIGLDVDLKIISENIEKRVVERFDNGVIVEIKKLNKICAIDDFPACTTLGVSDLSAYLDSKIDKKKCLDDWALHELQYAKRQLVWLKKENDVVWLDDLGKSSYTLSNEKIFI